MQIDEPRFLGNRLQRETWLTDTEGRHFRVAEMMGKPLILLLSYYGCDGTCPTMNAELAKVLEKVKRFRLGKDGVEKFAGEVGFRFFWSDAAKAFLHPNVLVFLTPEGRVARYIYGTRMDVQTIELAITDADWERIASSTAVFDMITGACFSYNYAEGRYQWNYSLLAGVGSLLLGLVSMGSGALIYRRRMSRRQGNGIEGKKGEARNA
jgi:protein SCO1/2